MDDPPHHLYVHVPFCRLVCAYCDFVTVGGRADDLPRYTDALLAELAVRPAPGELRTIYFGGGTPSLLSPEQVGRVISAARDRWARVALEEVTLEANPSRREAPDWAGLREAGVTRHQPRRPVLRDDDLRALARGHDAEEAVEAFAGARAADFESVSIDLIYGIPGQAARRLARGPRGPRSISGRTTSAATRCSWCWSPTSGRRRRGPGALRWRTRMAERTDDELAAEQYGLAQELLEAAGYRHYELSSWALPGHEARHNAAYWSRHAYTGIGAGAHSYDGAGERSWNARDLDEYLGTVEAGRRPVAGFDGLTRARAPSRPWRSACGGSTGSRAAASRPSSAPIRSSGSPAASARSGPELIEIDEERLRLTPTGRLLASEACLAFLPA